MPTPPFPPSAWGPLATWQTRMDHPPPVTSYASSSSDLFDKLRFPRFSRTAPDLSLAARGLVRFITDLGWRTMILHHDVEFVLSLFDT